MLSWRVFATLGGLALLNLNMTTCRSPGEGSNGSSPAEQEVAESVDLPGVDTSELTRREKSQWSQHVTEQLAPCKDVPVSLAQCVKEKRGCSACLPAAKYLKAQVTEGRTKGQVEAAYRIRFAPDAVEAIDVGGSPTLGPDDAIVTIVEWADFECGACRAAKPIIESLLRDHSKSVRLVFKHYPLTMHEHAETAARAAVAAQRQGKFWEMHKVLFETDPPLKRPVLDRLARQVGLDAQKFTADIDSEGVADTVAHDRKQGEAVGLTGTPTIYINGRHFNYAADFESELKHWVKLELELLGSPASENASPAPAVSGPADAGAGAVQPASGTGAKGNAAGAGSAMPPGSATPPVMSAEAVGTSPKQLGAPRAGD